MQMTIHVEDVRCLTEERAGVAAGLGGTSGASGLLEPGLYSLACHFVVQATGLLTMNSWMVNSSGRVDEPEPEPEPWVAVGAGAADVAAAEVVASATAEEAAAAVLVAAAEVAAAEDAAAVFVGVVEPEPEAPSQTAGPGMGYSVLPE